MDGAEGPELQEAQRPADDTHRMLDSLFGKGEFYIKLQEKIVNSY
jgi:hypothetical protein